MVNALREHWVRVLSRSLDALPADKVKLILLCMPTLSILLPYYLISNFSDLVSDNAACGYPFISSSTDSLTDPSLSPAIKQFYNAVKSQHFEEMKSYSATVAQWFEHLKRDGVVVLSVPPSSHTLSTDLLGAVVRSIFDGVKTSMTNHGVVVALFGPDAKQYESKARMVTSPYSVHPSRPLSPLSSVFKYLFVFSLLLLSFVTGFTSLPVCL